MVARFGEKITNMKQTWRDKYFVTHVWSVMYIVTDEAEESKDTRDSNEWSLQSKKKKSENIEPSTCTIQIRLSLQV